MFLSTKKNKKKITPPPLLVEVKSCFPRGASQFYLNLFPHPQPLSQRWERGDIILVKRIPYLGEGVRG
jgi:hypothetical protein